MDYPGINRNETSEKTQIIVSVIAITLIVSFITAFIAFFAFSIKVPAGYVGIKINLYGDEQGVAIKPLHTGRNFYNSITHDVVKYPTFVQQIEYHRINFQDIDGLVIQANVGVQYKFQAEKVPGLYEEYRTNAREITDNYMQTWVKNALNKTASKYKVDKLYGEDKEKFRIEALTALQSDFKDKGIEVNDLYFVDEMSLPSEVLARISDKINATQLAIQKENELRAEKAENEKRITKSEGSAKVRIIEATAYAEAKMLQAEAEAKANKIVNQSLTTTLVEYNKVLKWNGAMPQVTSSSGLIIDLK